MVVLWSINQSHGDRNVFVLEEPDALRYTILVNFKIRFGQIGDQAALPVGHGGVQHHQGYVHRDSERSRIPILWYLGSPIPGVARQDSQEKDRESDGFSPSTLSRLRQSPAS